MQFAAFALGACLVAGPALGQTIDPNAIREEDLWQHSQKKIAILNFIPMASRRATALLEAYELDGWSFYRLGGAIKPKEKYLLGLNRTQDRIDVFSLEEVPVNRNIFWSDTRDEIVAALRKSAR